MKVAQTLPPSLAGQLESLGERLKQLRIARRVTQDEAAARAGISRTTLYQIESGSPKVAIGQIIRYLDALAPGKTLANLLVEEDPSVRALQESTRRVRARALSPAELKEIDF
ncbi:MAG: helix-turn-helix transcriptional regulator [Rhodocyclaceae bacterium]|nr:helix-turn-helix transcriptional regulator [Rhodocyclaceae bacterium]